MTSLELLKEFYNHSEQDCDNDWKLACLNQAYQQVKGDLELVETLRTRYPEYYKILKEFLDNDKSIQRYDN